MSWLLGFWERIGSLLRRGRVEQELDEELRFHIDMDVRKAVSQGVPPAEARRRALKRLGGLEQVKEKTRDERGVRLFEDLLADLRYAARRLANDPGFLVVTVASLAIGIGANTAIYSQLEAVLVRTLPVKDPHQLVLFNWDAPPSFNLRSQTGWMDVTEAGLATSTAHPYPMLGRFRSQLEEEFSEIFAFFDLWSGVSVGGDGGAELVGAQLVSGNYFAALGVGAAVGRTIEPADDIAGAAPVAMISYGYWQRRFGGDPEVIGQPLQINGQPYLLIGVAAKGFTGTLQVGDAPEVTLPLSLEGAVQRRRPSHDSVHRWWVLIMGRLRDGVSMQRAETAADAILRESVRIDRGIALDSEEPLPGSRLTSGSRGLEDVRRRMTQPLMVLTGVVVLLLLVSCANISGLLLARGAALRKEIAIRISIGAGRGRVVRQLLTENFVIAVLGGLAGVLLAYWSEGVVSVVVARTTHFAVDTGARIDGSVLLFASALCLLSVILFGLLPALRSSAVDTNSALKGNLNASRRSSRLAPARVVVMLQVALSVTALVIAGLFVGTLHQVLQQDAGAFDPRQVSIFKAAPSLNGYDAQTEKTFVQRALEHLRQLPGVEQAAACVFTPLGIVGSRGPIVIAGESGQAAANVDRNWVSAGFFATLRIPILAGRGVTDRDSPSAPRVAVINETMRRQYFSGDSPIGARFGPTAERSSEIEVIGVVPDVKYRQLRDDPTPSYYLALSQRDRILGDVTFLLRSETEQVGERERVQALFAELDRDVPLFSFGTLQNQVAAASSAEKHFALLSSLLAGIALSLACLGLYGMVSYSVNRRTREFGIRAALGARRSVLVRMVLKESLFAAVGIGLGIAISLLVGRGLSEMLFGLSYTDITPHAAAAAILLLVALLAVYLPARRAAGVDPASALRTD